MFLPPVRFLRTKEGLILLYTIPPTHTNTYTHALTYTHMYACTRAHTRTHTQPVKVSQVGSRVLF